MQLPDFSKVKILVIGDLMLDCYWQGEATRISPEAPVPVVKVNGHKQVPGGAANVAMNAAALGAQVTLIGAVGEDEAAVQLHNLLKEKAVRFQPITTAGPTILKWRVLSHHQQLLRLDFEDIAKSVWPAEAEGIWAKALGEVDGVILSDYGKGVVQAIPNIIATAKRLNKPVFVDPKLHDYSAYRGATCITPNWKEFQEALGKSLQPDDEEAIVHEARQLISQYDLTTLLVTRSERGMTGINQDTVWQLKATAREVYDVTGAGDTVIAVLACAYLAGESFENAMQCANQAAGIVIGKLGTATVSPEELDHAISHGHNEKIVTLEQLKKICAREKDAGRTIVMTNGCFDILHAGHVYYLAKAKALGHYLIVAINDDNSVKRLKGEARPVNPIIDRMTVLSALEAVDYVIPFAADTPADLIEQILPDVLVKGGDYTPETIAGASTVIKHGGRVEIIPLKAGCSSTAIIQKMQKGEL